MLVKKAFAWRNNMQKPFLIKLFFNWCVINADFNILSIITERFTENRESSNVLCIVIDCHAQLHAAAIVQIKVPDGDI